MGSRRSLIILAATVRGRDLTGTIPPAILSNLLLPLGQTKTARLHGNVQAGRSRVGATPI